MLHAWVKKLSRLVTAKELRKQPIRRKPGARRPAPARLTIEGLEDRFMPALVMPAFHPTFEVAPHQQGNHPALTPAAATPTGFSPLQIRTAYGINSSSATGAGQTIAIVDAYNDPKIFADLDVFDKQFAATSSGSSLYSQYGASSSFLTVYNQNGQVINPTSTSIGVDQTGNWETEESLDVEWAHAVAPGAKIALVEANDNSGNLYTAVGAAAHLPGVSAVSMSWGGGEFGGENFSDSTFTTPAGHTGVTFLASTGDNSVGEYPAFSPNVVAVGGTTLTLNADNSIHSETAWSTGSDPWNLTLGTGGGTSAIEGEPAYQQGFQSTGRRTIPDVSFDADPKTGVAIYDSFGTSSAPAPGWEQIGGTSLSAPAWAGLIAMANQHRVQSGMATLNSSSPTQAQSLLYGLSASAFHDITSGSITGNGHTYTAGVGYDEVTGLGSPASDRVVDGLSGLLDLKGDQSAVNQSDSFTIGTTASGGLLVTINGKTESLPAGAIRTINVDTAGGTNSVQVKALPAGVTLNVNTLTTNHSDTVTVGGTGTSLANIAGTVNVSNGSGGTSVVVDGSGDSVGRTYQVRPSSVQVSGMPGVVNYGGLDTNALSVIGSSGGNRMDVYGTYVSAPVALNAGSGVNSVLVHNAASAVSITGNGTNYVNIGADGSLTGITAPVNVNNSYNSNTGAYGKSYVTINDSTDPVGRNVTISSGSIAFQGLTTINLNDPALGTSHVAGVTINDALHQANHYTVNSVQASDPVTINGDTLDTLSGPASNQVSFNSTAHS
jgi:subtilase family serine protease